MAAKRTRRRPQTERVTVRLETDLLESIDAMVSLRQFNNRSDAIRQAVMDMLDSRADKATEYAEKITKLRRLAALADQADSIHEDLLSE